jgi:hypothetical protein
LCIISLGRGRDGANEWGCCCRVWMEAASGVGVSRKT